MASWMVHLRISLYENAVDFDNVFMDIFVMTTTKIILESERKLFQQM